MIDEILNAIAEFKKAVEKKFKKTWRKCHILTEV